MKQLRASIKFAFFVSYPQIYSTEIMRSSDLNLVKEKEKASSEVIREKP